MAPDDCGTTPSAGRDLPDLLGSRPHREDVHRARRMSTEYDEMTEQPSIWDKPALAQEHSETSRAAARKIEPHRPNLRDRVEAVIRRFGGLTAEEIERETGLAGNTVRPRIVELVERRRVRDSGITRKTKANRDAVVWVTTR